MAWEMPCNAGKSRGAHSLGSETAHRRGAAGQLDPEEGSPARRHGRIKLIYDQRTPSSRFGMKPENLSRALASRSCLSGAGREIFIIDFETLKTVARPSILIDG